MQIDEHALADYLVGMYARAGLNIRKSDFVLDVDGPDERNMVTARLTFANGETYTPRVPMALCATTGARH